ncbi:MAG: PHP domain-containing protein [Caloramator sp.]|nr:PHP domain-containing protein [Caloramator sp.]
MKFYYDLHIHTALSPCADDDMTPNNILNMAKLKGLDIIAITDHNSCKNLKPCLELGNELEILVIPGMELQTMEEVHVLCLFKTLEAAIEFQDFVYSNLPKIKNKKELFGKQLIFNELDEVVGEEELMLLSSANLSIDKAYNKVKSLDGLFIPSHIDKESFSIISNLGFVPFNLDIKALEYVDIIKLEKFKAKGLIPSDIKYIKNSDAHHLGLISERENYINLNSLTIDDFFAYFDK